jgi:predicted aminopeptidase
MRGLFRFVCLSSFAIALSGCALPYYWQAVGGQLDLLRKRSPIDTVVADDARDEHTRAMLRTVAELRQFAIETLLLPDNGSYTTYVDLGRPYVVWNVVAADKFSVDPQTWCFPFAGCVAYRGYFDRIAAETFQRRLDERGLDTYSGGSGAYSTLGYFADPVLNTMLGGGVEFAAAILFHELAHQRLYVRGDSELSEGFATAVEEYGVEMWLRESGDAEALDRYLRRIGRREEFAALVADHRSRLREVYATDAADADKLAAKAAVFAAMHEAYAELRKRWGGIGDYDAWFEQPLNNATLAAIATYRQWLPALQRRLRSVGLEQFYAEVEEIAALPSLDRTLALEAWQADAGLSGS